MAEMDIEKLNEEFNRLSDELKRLKPDDPTYRTVSENQERLAKIINEYERRDLERINNNVRNDINEENVRVDFEKVKTDRLREWLGLAKTGLSVAGGLAMGAIAYKGELVDFKLPFRSMWDLAKGLIPKK